MLEHAQLQRRSPDRPRDHRVHAELRRARAIQPHARATVLTDVFALALSWSSSCAVACPRCRRRLHPVAVASRDPTVRPTPRAFGVAVNDDVEMVFRRALAVSPRERYKTAGQFWLDLHAAAFPGSAQWSPVTIGGGASAAAFASPATTPGGMPMSMRTGPNMGQQGSMSTSGRTGPRLSVHPTTGASHGWQHAPTTPLFAPGGTGGGGMSASAAPKKSSGTVVRRARSVARWAAAALR